MIVPYHAGLYSEYFFQARCLLNQSRFLFIIIIILRLTEQTFTDLEPSPVCGFCSRLLKFPREDGLWEEDDTGL